MPQKTEPGAKEKTDRRGPLLSAAILLIIAASAFIFGFHKIDDWDFLWHLRTGAHIIKAGPPHTDLYSFTAAGKQWIDSQWLFQVIIFLVYRLDGFAGESWLLATLAAVIWGLLFFAAPDWETRTIAFPGIMLALWAASPRINLRPEMFSYLLTAVYLLVLERNRKSATASIYLLPFLQLLWVNLEGLWPIGLVIIGAYLAEAIIGTYLSKADAAPSRILAVLLIAACACLLNPYFVRGFVFPLTLLQDIAGGSNLLRKIIEEAQPPFPAFRFPLVEIPLLILIAVSGLSFFLNRSKLRPAHWLLWLAFLFLALGARRNIAFICILSCPVLAFNFAAGLAAKPSGADLGRRLKIFCAALGIGLALFLDGTIASGKFHQWDRTRREFGAGFDFSKYPVAAANFLKAVGWKGNLFSQLQMGGFVIAKGYPDWKVYVDGRLQVYGSELVKTYLKSLKDYPTFRAESDKFGIDAVLLDSSDAMVKPLIKNLMSDPEWAPVFADYSSVVFLKDNARNHQTIQSYRIQFSR